MVDEKEFLKLKIYVHNTTKNKLMAVPTPSHL